MARITCVMLAGTLKSVRAFGIFLNRIQIGVSNSCFANTYAGLLVQGFLLTFEVETGVKGLLSLAMSIMVGEEGGGIAMKGYIENLRLKSSGEECKLPKIILTKLDHPQLTS